MILLQQKVVYQKQKQMMDAEKQHQSSTYNFYEPENKEMNKIITEIHGQEKNILKLLNKYQSSIPDVIEESTRSREEKLKNKESIRYHKQKRNQFLIGRKEKYRSLDPQEKKIVKSYEIGEKSKSKLLKNNKLKLPRFKKFDSPSIYGFGQEQNQKKPKKLYQLFESMPTRKKDIPSRKKHLVETSMISQRESNKIISLSKYSLPPTSYTIPQPINHNISMKTESSSSSSEAEVPLIYTTKKFNQLLKEQLKQELNFLYWSSNIPTKEWAQEFNLLLKKHDEGIEKFNGKMKVFKDFDERFWVEEIYRRKNK